MAKTKQAAVATLTASEGSSREPRRPNQRRRKFDFRVILFVVVVAILLWEVLVPLFLLVWGSISGGRPGSSDFFSFGSLTLDNFRRAFEDPGRLAGILGNTSVFAGGTTVVGFVLGTYLAWVVERTNAPFRRIILVLCVIRLIVPGVLTTVSWALLASPRIGTLNAWAESLFGLDSPPFNIYSMAGMIWIEALDVFPVAFLLMAAALRSMDPSLEEASLASGHGMVSTTLRITFPLVLPAILATFILLMIRGIETFETPTLIGLPAGITTFVVEIWRKTSSSPTDMGLAAVYSVLVMAFCVTLVWAYNRFTRRSEMFAVVGGKAFRPKRVELSPIGRWVASGVAGLILLFSIGLPMMMLAWAAVQPPFSGVPPLTWSALTNVSGLSLDNFSEAFELPLTRRAFINSTILGAGAATVVVALMSVTAWITVKSRIPGRRILDHLAFAPIAIPGIMMGVAFLWLYVTVPIPLYGTLWILLALYVARFTPVALRIISAANVQISDELVEAAEVSGATWWQGFRTIVLPLLRPGLLAAWIFVMIHAFRELAASMLVYTFGTEVIGIAIFDLWETGSFGLLSAFGIAIILFLLAASALASLVSGRFGVRE
jgi:iron(III) transport system permease protein